MLQQAQCTCKDAHKERHSYAQLSVKCTVFIFRVGISVQYTLLIFTVSVQCTIFSFSVQLVIFTCTDISLQFNVIHIKFLCSMHNIFSMLKLLYQPAFNETAVIAHYP